jgi:hypothetical protein
MERLAAVKMVMPATYIVYWRAKSRANKEVPSVFVGMVGEEDEYPLVVGAGNAVK